MLVKRLGNLHGILGVKKMAGESSAQVVEKVKRNILSLVKEALSRKAFKDLEKKVKVGHGGTLDPIATGVLVIGIGNGCKQMQTYLKGVDKTYKATGVFGKEFDTFDRTGVCLEEKPFDTITKEAVETILKERFTGDIKQRPPVFSALHVNGERSYDIARKRQKDLLRDQEDAKKAKLDQQDQPSLQQQQPIVPESLELPERKVTISRLELSSFELPQFVLEMDCGSGTYVRSLIHDLGRALNSVAAMYELERTSQGPIKLVDCVEVDDFKDLDKIEPLLNKENNK